MNQSLTPADMHRLFEPAKRELHSLHIFNLTDVPYVDSSGLGVLVTHHARCRKKGARLVLAGVNPRVLHLLQITNINHIIPTAPSVEEVAQA
jgi:anti-anti-sigma factor